MEKNKVKVLINGTEYTLVTSEPAEYVQKVAIRVDRKFKEIKRNHPALTNNMVAILTAINMTDEYIKMEESSDNLRKQIADYAKNEKLYSSMLSERNKRIAELESMITKAKK